MKGKNRDGFRGENDTHLDSPYIHSSPEKFAPEPSAASKLGVYLEDTDLTLYQGDVTEVLRSLPDGSVHCVVTSPPYWGLRDYGTGVWDGGNPDCDHVKGKARQDNGERTWDGGAIQSGDIYFSESCGKCGARRVDNQLGLEPTPDLYLESMVAVFREVRRVLRADGTCWLNIGDSYNGGGPNGGYSEKQASNAGSDGAVVKSAPGLKQKDLCMIPARLALALQADGWWLRSQIVWSKPNPMPESVTDRPTSSYELVYLLTKSPRYFFDAEAVREPHLEPWRSGTNEQGPRGFEDGLKTGKPKWEMNGRNYNPAGRNVRNVWEIATQPYPEAHFATYPEELVRRCILAGSSERGCCPECGAPWERVVEATGGSIGKAWHDHSDDLVGRGQKAAPLGDYQRSTAGWRPSCRCDPDVRDMNAYPGRQDPCTVLDPFFGSGTTGLVARKHGRRTVGIELSPSYCALAARRLAQLSLLSEVNHVV